MSEKAGETPGKTARELELEARIVAIAELGRQGYSAGLRDGAARGFDMAIALVESFAKARGMALGRPVPIGVAIARIAESLRLAKPRVFRAPPGPLEEPATPEAPAEVTP